jgi:hypothetical protein
MQEKRKLERFDLRVSARVEDAGKRNGREILDLITSDICAGGAFFETDHSLPEGTKVRVDLVLPLGGIRRLIAGYDHASIRVTGTVIRTDPGGMAVSFNNDYSIRPRKGSPPGRH